MIAGRMTVSMARFGAVALGLEPDPQRAPDQVRGLGDPWPAVSRGRRGHQHREHLLVVDAAVGHRVEDQQPPVAALQPASLTRRVAAVPAVPAVLCAGHAVPPSSLSRRDATAVLLRMRSTSASSRRAPCGVSL